MDMKPSPLLLLLLLPLAAATPLSVVDVYSYPQHFVICTIRDDGCVGQCMAYRRYQLIETKLETMLLNASATCHPSHDDFVDVDYPLREFGWEEKAASIALIAMEVLAIVGMLLMMAQQCRGLPLFEDNVN